ncbi:unnamed protein product [Pedinophyceae sp. YPF-701]|nr:unnamed protein product [Pedinophyceae sp. YPF-701]
MPRHGEGRAMNSVPDTFASGIFSQSSLAPSTDGRDLLFPITSSLPRSTAGDDAQHRSTGGSLDIPRKLQPFSFRSETCPEHFLREDFAIEDLQGVRVLKSDKHETLFVGQDIISTKLVLCHLIFIKELGSMSSLELVARVRCRAALKHPSLLDLWVVVSSARGDQVGFVYEPCDGIALNGWLKANSATLTERQVYSVILTQFHSLLTYLNSMSMIHGPANPADLLMTETGELKALLDPTVRFSLYVHGDPDPGNFPSHVRAFQSIEQASRLAAPAAPSGRPSSAAWPVAPELFHGQSKLVSSYTDVWTIGCLGSYCITRGKAFSARHATTRDPHSSSVAVSTRGSMASRGRPSLPEYGSMQVSQGTGGAPPDPTPQAAVVSIPIMVTLESKSLLSACFCSESICRPALGSLRRHPAFRRFVAPPPGDKRRRKGGCFGGGGADDVVEPGHVLLPAIVAQSAHRIYVPFYSGGVHNASFTGTSQMRGGENTNTRRSEAAHASVRAHTPGTANALAALSRHKGGKRQSLDSKDGVEAISATASALRGTLRTIDTGLARMGSAAVQAAATTGRQHALGAESSAPRGRRFRKKSRVVSLPVETPDLTEQIQAALQGAGYTIDIDELVPSRARSSARSSRPDKAVLGEPSEPESGARRASDGLSHVPRASGGAGVTSLPALSEGRAHPSFPSDDGPTQGGSDHPPATATAWGEESEVPQEGGSEEQVSEESSYELQPTR